MQWLLECWDWVRPHLGTVGLAFTWIGIGLVYVRKRSAWQRKSFMNQVNFSLNYVQDNKLCLRTLLETTAPLVWLNDYGVNKVFKAAARTRPDQPFIILDNPGDMAFAKRAVLNVLSERFADVFLGQSMSLPVKTAKYCFAITFENFPDMLTRKIRILLVETEALKHAFAPRPDGDLAVDEPRHRDRLAVLRTMREIYLGQQKLDAAVLGEVELGLMA